jgi:hypothetical protein
MYAKSNVSYSKKVNSTREPEKFCNACFKAGKDKSFYTSHFTKSVPGPRGIVVCPTVLSASCSYCGQSGHWANDKYCSAMRSDKKQTDKQTDKFSKVVNVSSVPLKSSKNEKRGGFASLCDSDDEDEKPIVGVKRERSTLPEAPLPKAGMSWASIASSAPPVKPIEKMGATTSYYIPTANSSEAEKEAFKILKERRDEVFSRINKKLSWTDEYYDDSDEENEADEEYVDNSAW